MHAKGSVILNELKHHSGAIRRFVRREGQTLDSAGLAARLKKIGESQMDLYLGRLTEDDIEEEVLGWLHERRITDAAAYRKWIEESHHYASVGLSDTSVWILRLGVYTDRYIHLHPGRYSPHTMRVKAGVLKTAIASSVAIVRTGEPISPDLVNKVRADVLHLPPLKNLDRNIYKLVEVILNKD